MPGWIGHCFDPGIYVGQTDAIAGCREDRIHVGTGPFCRLHDLVPTFYMTYTSVDFVAVREVLRYREDISYSKLSFSRPGFSFAFR